MTGSHSSSDPILRGIISALTAAEGLTAAFGNAEQVGVLNEEGFEHVNNLHRGRHDRSTASGKLAQKRSLSKAVQFTRCWRSYRTAT
ncbi:MAG TPA: hypothetical protein DC031_14530 [Sulfitobacter sp.]|jgi:hypothetical protein|nr:hypothetical protein [Sulfitobacter sp.]